MMCGMHVHVQLPDPEKRMAVMRATLPHLPLFIALSASSPLWNSRREPHLVGDAALDAAPDARAACARHLYLRHKWRAQRYGTDCIFASKDRPVTISELLSRIIDDIAEDADALGCAAQIEHCRVIVDRGSSAEFQLRGYRENGDDIRDECAHRAEHAGAVIAPAQASRTRTSFLKLVCRGGMHE